MSDATTSTGTELSRRTRAANLERMRRETFDIVVIGGGATGAGMALDAVSRGLTVALVEKHDFASGTSSRSSKLIHGGLRYLEHFEFALVREGLRERARLRRNAPHLGQPLPFLIPVYQSSERSPLGNQVLKLRLGLTLYDWLAGRQNFARHRWLTTAQALAFAPHLSVEGLRGAFVYYDGLTDDARLVIEIIKTAAGRGAVVANYVAASGFVERDSRIRGVAVTDTLSGEPLTVTGRIVINATGVWADDVMRLSDPAAARTLRPSKGIHVVLPAAKLNTRAAVLIPSLGEQRFLFVIPWQERIVIGTTDTDYAGDIEDPQATADEVRRVIESAAQSFPDANITTDDVISSFAGLRPLAGGAGATKELSRREVIIETKKGLISIIGGKLTTWRAMGERAVDRAVERLAANAPAAPIARSRSAEINLAHSERFADGINSEAARLASEFAVPQATAAHLLQSYGGNCTAVLELTRRRPELKQRLIADLPHVEAEVVYAAGQEMAMTVEDFLSRRTRISLLARDGGAACVARVTELLAECDASC
ncbi:MAG TPA: glycerol-3-phosphate dehydrogenase/oxidase [Blastocatellia bacterium]|nr:glycerol-3-phosphate dehydrogenase/oxidase [Blastocatellia bacterium]